MTILAFDHRAIYRCLYQCDLPRHHCRSNEFDFIVHNKNTLSTLKCIYLLLLLIFFLNVNSVVMPSEVMPSKIYVTVCVNVQLHFVVVLVKCMTFVSTN